MLAKDSSVCFAGRPQIITSDALKVLKCFRRTAVIPASMLPFHTQFLQEHINNLLHQCLQGNLVKEDIENPMACMNHPSGVHCQTKCCSEKH